MEKMMMKLPPWLVLLLGLLLVALLGWVDFVTGDYSILIFYAVPVTGEAWFLGAWGAVIASLCSGAARLLSEYLTYADFSASSYRWWNSVEDMLFLLMVGLLIARVKKLLIQDEDDLQK